MLADIRWFMNASALSCRIEDGMFLVRGTVQYRDSKSEEV